MTTPSSDELDVQLKPLRDAIDSLDDRIVALLSERFVLVREVAKVKSRLRAAVLANARFQQIKTRLCAAATTTGLDPDMVGAIYEAIHISACEVEKQIVAAENA
jgi:chorismate mutase